MSDTNTATIPTNGNATWLARFNAYGALFVTFSVFSMLLLMMLISAKSSDLSPAFSNLMETVKLLAVSVTSYWVGNSHMASKQADTIAANAAALAMSTPVIKPNP